MTTPMIDAPEEKSSGQDELPSPTQSMPRPFRLNLLGLGAAVALFARLAAANGFGDLDGATTLSFLALGSGLGGLSLLLIAAERDRISAPLGWISLVTALSWGTLNWISPPFADGTIAFDSSLQPALAALGAGNGLLLAGIVTLALVRRAPTLTVASALIAAVVGLASTTVLLRSEWPAIGVVGAMFALWLFAWDRSPRREQTFVLPEFSPRFSRSALSLVSVVFCGTALQLWWSRSSIPRSLPAVGFALVLVGAAFASMWRVRREIEQRETMLEEWRTWMREIRHTDFRAEMKDFDSVEVSGEAAEAPRKLSFPDLVGSADLQIDPASLPVRDGIDPLHGGPVEGVRAADDTALLSADDTALLGAGASGWLDAPAAVAPPIDIPTAAPALPIDIPTAGPEVEIAEVEIAATAPLIDIPSATPKVETATETVTEPAAEVSQDFADLLAWIDGPAFDLPTADTLATQTSTAGPDTAEVPVVHIATPTPTPTPSTGLPTADTPATQTPTAPPATAPANTPATQTATTPANTPDTPDDPEVHSAAAPTPAAKGAFSALLAEPVEPEPMQSFATLRALDEWLAAPGAATRSSPLLVAVEAMALPEYDSLPAGDALIASQEIGSYLADSLPEADLIAWIDGPYFIAAYPSVPASEIPNLTTNVVSVLKSTDGTHAFVRPRAEGQLDDLVEQAVLGLLHARRNQQVMARR